jgi:hypothetical protein
MPTSGWCSNLRLPNKLARKTEINIEQPQA